MKIKTLSDDELLISLENHFAMERSTSHHILLHLKEVQIRFLYAERGYPDLYLMLIKHFHQSETSANQRLKALDLMLDVPIVEERLMSGDLNMSTVAMAQRQIKREEKLTGAKVSNEKKLEIVEAITCKTMAQAETELFKHLPETNSHPATLERRVSADAVRLSVTLPDDVRDMMTQLQERWAHVDPSMDPVEVMRRAFSIALEKTDRTKKKTRQNRMQGATESAKHRGNKRLTFYGVDFDCALWGRAQSRCEFVDPRTGRRCDCKFGLQREHVIPLALGGTNELSNMQLLCGPHNRLRARKVFGNKKIDSFIARDSS